MADLTEEEDKELKGTDVGHAEGVGIRRDFSVIHSKQLKKNHLFLGPARFVNVSVLPPSLSTLHQPLLVFLLTTPVPFLSMRPSLLPVFSPLCHAA